MNLWTFVTAFLVVAVNYSHGAQSNSYVVIAPAKIRPGMTYSISVNILKASGDVTVTASISGSSSGQVVSQSAVLQQDVPSQINLQIPENMKTEGYTLEVVGSGGLVFSNKTSIPFSSKSMSLLVQTDKAMYKPGQTVNFRVLGMYPDLSVYSGQMDIEIIDAQSNKIKQWLGVYDASGVITQSLSLSTQPVLGDWKIKVTAGDVSEEKAFTIRKYVLPKFEVTVDLPSYSLASSAIPATISAKYTYGKPVEGSVVITANVVNRYLHGTPATVQRTGQLDNQGQVVISFSHSELQQLHSSFNGQTLVFTANVTESLTGITLTGNSTVKVYARALKLEYPASNPSTFKPGLDYVGYVKLSQQDGLPIASPVGKSVSVIVKTTELGDPSKPYLTHSRTLPTQTLALTDNGLIPLQISIPANASTVTITTNYNGIYKGTTLKKSYTKSGNNVQLFLSSSEQLRAGGRAHFLMKSTEKVQKLAYQVMSRGSIVTSGSVNVGDVSSKRFSVDVTPAMAPNSRIVVYYVRTNGEVITDSISFDVDGAFQNQVSLSMNRTEAEPAQKVKVTVNADPQSTAYLLAVDQSVLLLKSGNDITASQVIEDLKSYDTTKTQSLGIRPIPFGRPIGILERRKRMVWFPYPIYYGGSDPTQIFNNAGVKVMTDALVFKHYEPIHYHHGLFLGSMFHHIANTGGSNTNPQEPSVNANDNNEDLQEVSHVRNVFPETWLWNKLPIDNQGEASLNLTVPDTITSWVASAFAVNPQTGLGVAPTTSKLKVFKPFFVSLNLPYSVIRGEQVVVQAIVFNYLPTDQQVHVTLTRSSQFYNLVRGANGQEDMNQLDKTIVVTVPAGEGKNVFFPIVPATMGNLKLTVSARSTQAADAVSRILLVQAEGSPKEYSMSVLVDLKNTNSFSENVPLSLPPNVVTDSVRIRATAIGDLMGPTISGLDQLLKMPTGCGEQNMIGMAPDVFVTSYLQSVNQLSGDIKDKAIGFMEHGYQRELTYKHKDHSFSAFGDRDPSGSMWLTAFVVKTFHQAKPFIFIDDSVIANAITWMLDRQSKNGSFPEPGRVIHKNMQGAAGTGPGLTAFVLVSLMENKDITGNLRSRIASASTAAIAYLNSQLSTITDDYLLAMTTYALTLAQDPSAQSSFNTLVANAVSKDGLRYWHRDVPQTTTTTQYWRRPAAASTDVEMTAYALLTYAAKNDFAGGLDIMKWIAKQRNSRGGYQSTQDTVLALQALSAFAKLAYSETFNSLVTVQSGSFSHQFSINRNNALVLQSQDIPATPFPSSVDVTAQGSGISLVEISVFFNVEAEVEEPMFDLTVTLLRDSQNLLKIKSCAKMLSGVSGMAVQEVGVPSGFEVDLESIESADVLKQTDIEDNKLILYFDEVGPVPVCTTFNAERVGLVAKAKPVAVRIFDYYEPEKQATAFYSSQVLNNTSVCDVCKSCDCPVNV